MISPREFSVFTVVGTTATAVHLSVVAGGVPLGLSPLLANVVGFFFSFAVSFIGHALWSFPIGRKDVPSAIRRFAVVSVLAFGLNELCYAGALRWTEFDYRLALFGIILSIAGLKMLVSKHWAFAVA
jgi:putative flippase GtrA